MNHKKEVYLIFLLIGIQTDNVMQIQTQNPSDNLGIIVEDSGNLNPKL